MDEKREKVLKGLECCASGNSCQGKCPYDEIGDQWTDCVRPLARDALSLLKANKAQILTLDEVRGLVGIPCWAQYYVLSEAEGQAPILQSGWAIVQAFDEDEEHFVSFATAYGMERWHVATYGTRWMMFDKEPKLGGGKDDRKQEN